MQSCCVMLSRLLVSTFFFSSRRRHTRLQGDWSSDVCSSDLPVGLGAQNFYPENEGAFTGEVSPTMLIDVGCQYVIIGHSERRHKMGEDDAFINRKVHAGLKAGLKVILCVGETLQEREAGKMQTVLVTQA